MLGFASPDLPGPILPPAILWCQVLLLEICQVTSRSMAQDFAQWMKANFIEEIPTTIGSLADAIVYWRSNQGGTVPGNETLYAEMLAHSSFDGAFGSSGSVTKVIKKKIQDAIQSRQATISAAPGSYCGLTCTTLGSYRLDIAYNHRVSKGENEVQLMLSGSDRWDFDTNPNKGLFHNLFHEWIPSVFAGKGTPFFITYDFAITIQVEV
jgi:hypothetical protein